jgi:phosphohistidine phosphatase
MAPELWMLRHGEAVPHDSKPDGERELTPRGEAQAEAAGVALAALNVEFAACYTSPKIRARDTARLTCARLNVEPEEHAALGAAFTRDDALELVHAHAGEDDPRVLVVGHNPDFAQVVYDFTGAHVAFPKGGIAALSATRTGARLFLLLRPRELEAVARGR